MGFEGFRGIFGKPAVEATGVYKVLDVLKNPLDSFSNAFGIIKIGILLVLGFIVYKKFG